MADAKTTALTADTAPVGADLIMTVDDVAGTPTNKKVTLTNLAASAPFSDTYAPKAGVGCRLNKTADQSIAANTTAAVSFDAEAFDTDAFHDNATNNTRITIPTGKGGLYLFGASGQANTARVYLTFFRLNGTTNVPGGARQDLATASASFDVPPQALSLAAGDYVEFMVQNQNATNTLEVRGTGATSNVSASFWCTRIGS